MKKTILFAAILLLVCGCANTNNEPEANPTVREDLISQSSESNECISTDESWNRIGEMLCVEYTVNNPSSSRGGNIFLNEKQNYTQGFTTTIFASAKNRFNDPIKEYGHKKIQVTGLIKLYQGHPEIIADTPNQIKIVG